MVEGYFDKEENHTLIMRNVARAASAGFVKDVDFQKFWPFKSTDNGNHVTSLSTEERKEWLRKLKEKYKLK